jgi:hypothetical protein
LHEATFGHTLKVYRQEKEDGFYFRTVDEDGKSCLEAVLLTVPMENVTDGNYEEF